MDMLKDGQAGGRTNGRTGVQTDGRTDGRTDERRGRTKGKDGHLKKRGRTDGLSYSDEMTHVKELMDFIQFQSPSRDAVDDRFQRTLDSHSNGIAEFRDQELPIHRLLVFLCDFFSTSFVRSFAFKGCS